MPTIHRLNIKNFRGIKSFEQVFSSDFVCIIGRGDVGKSTILEAISHVLSPNWNITYYDNDFYNCDLNNSIEIEAVIKDIPVSLITEEKFGGYINGLNTDTNNIEEELEDHHEKVLIIRLEVDKDLEPKWSVVCNRHDPKPISATDRGKLNMFITSVLILLEDIQLVMI
jgi:predicted ATP-dependent endonuclease of OLD family